MRKLIALSLAAPMALVVSLSAADAPSHVSMTPASITWMDGPPSLPKGGKMAVLEGDPSKKGFFVLRARLPDGYRIAPHWHLTTERITVLSGTFHIGMGDTFDASKADAIPAGGYVSMPPKRHHYVWTEGETDSGRCDGTLRSEVHQPGGRSEQGCPGEVTPVWRRRPRRRYSRRLAAEAGGPTLRTFVARRSSACRPPGAA